MKLGPPLLLLLLQMTCPARQSALWIAAGRANDTNAAPVYTYFFNHTLEVIQVRCRASLDWALLCLPGAARHACALPTAWLGSCSSPTRAAAMAVSSCSCST